MRRSARSTVFPYATLCRSSTAIAAKWTSDLAAGLPGLALQWALIPLAAYWTESLIAKRNH